MASADPSQRLGLEYPQGWFQLAYASDVPVGQVVKLRYFGQELVLFRAESGQAQVLDAYCAHLGSHLGVGGVVSGECIRCPFHSWAYGTDGVCREIPYAERIPRGARVRAWPTLERSGLIFMWCSADGSAPSWEPPEVPEFDDRSWVGYHRQQYVLRTAAQEILENVFDLPHGQYVHQNAQGSALPIADFTFDGHRGGGSLRDRHSTGGRRDAPRSYIARTWPRSQSVEGPRDEGVLGRVHADRARAPRGQLLVRDAAQYAG
jgi:phenylpropionate dioxygenase-like ring-hydroxylating dioxygenase large terminal subunit